jgi:asparagine synthase (glutamine-hydrolysing)
VSGIAGVIRLDGQPVTDSDTATLQHAIARRGPDATGEWVGRAELLLHSLLRTTSESAQESQPLLDARSGCVIVADLRLDYREELLAQLGFPVEPRAAIGDAQLVLAAYQRWGTHCPVHLDGDFAFAIWDPRQHTLFCARDPFGVKPFLYCLLSGKLFAFASQARALLGLREMPHTLDEQRIADFLALHFRDTESTFYRDLRRLPGGHSLLLRDAKLHLNRYWSIERVRPLPLASDEEYAAGYCEYFSAAVRTRMRVGHASELGSMLSGGLDSSTITCCARDVLSGQGRQLPVFSWVFSDAMEADEREYQQAIIGAGGLHPHTLDSANAGYSPWTDLERFMPDGPLYAPNFYLNYAVGNLARGAGVRTILDGLGGDSTISRGSARLIELFLGGRERTLAHELRSMSRLQLAQGSVAKLFLTQVIAPLTPPGLRRLARRLCGKRPTQPASALLAPRLAAMTHAACERFSPALTAREQHLAQQRSPFLAEGLELFDRVLAECQVEGRYPFFDRRLAEYCLSLPADQKLAHGYSRIVARRALQGSVPDAVLWRAGKGKPGLHIIPALLSCRARLDDLFLRNPAVLAPYVNVDAARVQYSNFLQRRSDFINVIHLWNAAVLGTWLRCTQ